MNVLEFLKMKDEGRKISMVGPSGAAARQGIARSSLESNRFKIFNLS
jgi:hypothetical protein